MLAQQKIETKNPYQAIADVFSRDMRAVNTIILDHMDSSVPLVKNVASYLIMAGGKRVRPLLTLAFSALCGHVSQNSHRLAAAVEFIHTATLLHDDVVDESAQRRGKASANESFGNQTPVLVGDFLFSRSFQLMVATDSIEALKILSDASAVIAEGEVLQLSIHGKLDASLDDYFKVLEGKTAALFAAACEVGALISNADKTQQKAAHNYGLNLGLAFQIIDDVIDYQQKSDMSGKNQGDDFYEGKVTLPIFKLYETCVADEKEFLTHCLFANTRTEEDLTKTIQLFEKYNIFESCMETAQAYANKAIASLDAFPKNSLLPLLEDLVRYTLERNS